MAVRKLGALAIAFGAAALAPGVQAQGSACDQLKNRLATRLSADPRTYVLEAVPASTPLPPGGKFIGTCEGGAKKILYRKPTPDGAALSAALPAAAPPAAPPPALSPPVRREQPAGPQAETAPEPLAPPPPIAVEPPAVQVPAADPAPAPARSGPLVLARAWATAHWPWLAALLALPLLGFGWAWLAHRRAYDEAGLPRGPRLRP